MYHYEDMPMMGSSGIWDMPGSEAMMNMWGMIYRAITIHCVFFVVDTDDVLNAAKINEAAERAEKAELAKQKIAIAKKQIQRLLNEEDLRKSVLVVIFNLKRNEACKHTPPDKNEQVLFEE